MDVSTSSLHSEHSHQADSVIGGFADLLDKCDSVRHSTFQRSPKIPDQPGIKKKATFQLHSSILPGLRSQIVTLSDLTDPDDLSKAPGSQLKLISEVQSELNHTLDQMILAISILHAQPPDSSIMGSNDGHLEECKYFRLNNFLHGLADFLLVDIGPVCAASSKLIGKLKLITDPDQFNSDVYVVRVREDLLERKSDFLASIDGVIQWLTGTDFDIVQLGWKNEILVLDELLETIRDLTGYSVDPTEYNSLIPLAKLVIPLIKLSRIFFNKLSVQGMNRKRLPMYSKMCSHSLNSMASSLGDVIDDLSEIASLLRYDLRTPAADTCQSLIDGVQSLQDRLKSSLALIFTHFLPIIPDTENFPIQNYYKAWFATWQAMFTVAGDNLSKAAEGSISNDL
ncbi:hypothetical protein MJO28_008932 [Puccinia striiformis f. sp. tritici]|uniref:Uncharacterized protein n=1 Tax=Puccinia striiformis f. sp. tritici TaxID=168172 RepID=A0ACC0EDL6_9BASI|nr:hypothetical protein Pst134EA_015025 [Puccinia striiformis f. sp. tritici]KAH9462939.1 hypothetical protein Pst134EA_015025 [Puccinia striiformis f. sp. tritici]KAI7950111.1 hypothetical protein MJO28_008932 [Puccinia striiformis f. sp. tritici]KAI9603237.1 hypothetical protein H4Q26_002555 [Puccinia striiformis f. sp. tritici PST-130]